MSEDGAFDSSPIVDPEGKLSLLRYDRTPGECSE